MKSVAAYSTIAGIILHAIFGYCPQHTHVVDFDPSTGVLVGMETHCCGHSHTPCHHEDDPSHSEGPAESPDLPCDHSECFLTTVTSNIVNIQDVVSTSVCQYLIAEFIRPYARFVAYSRLEKDSTLIDSEPDCRITKCVWQI